MSETIPIDIMATAVRLYDGIRDCFDVYHYDEGEYGCSYGIEVEDVDVRNIIALAILDERERWTAAISARKQIYETKLEAADRFGSEDYTRWDLFKHAVEAFEHLDAAMIDGALT